MLPDNHSEPQTTWPAKVLRAPTTANASLQPINPMITCSEIGTSEIIQDVLRGTWTVQNLRVSRDDGAPFFWSSLGYSVSTHSQMVVPTLRRVPSRKPFTKRKEPEATPPQNYHFGTPGSTYISQHIASLRSTPSPPHPEEFPIFPRVSKDSATIKQAITWPKFKAQ